VGKVVVGGGNRVPEEDLLHGEVEEGRHGLAGVLVHKGCKLQQAVVGDDLPEALREN